MSISSSILNLSLPFMNHWGYWIILIAAMLEATPIFGLLIPGQVIAILGGFLAKTQVLDLFDVIWVCALGAVIGDLIGYLLGRRYGVSFISRYGRYFFFKKEHFEKTRELMSSHTAKTLIIGRFNSLTRAFGPFVAGASEVGFIRFLICNLIGGISWAAFFVMAGFIFGKSYEVASKYIGRFIFIGIALSIIMIYGYVYINKRRRIFAKYHLHVLLINIASLYIFSKMIEDVAEREFVARLDLLINEKVMLLWNPIMNKIWIF